MYELNKSSHNKDQELIEVLWAISVVSGRLARNLALLQKQSNKEKTQN